MTAAKLEEKNVLLCHTMFKDEALLAKYHDKYILVDGGAAPLDIVKLANQYGYKLAVSNFEVLALYKGVSAIGSIDFGGNKNKMAMMVAVLCKRLGKSAETLREELKFHAVLIFSSPFPTSFPSFCQVICDICSSTDGSLLGPRRNPEKDEQFTQIIMTNPDLIFKSQWPRPRFAAYACTVMLTALFEKTHGYELKYE